MLPTTTQLLNRVALRSGMKCLDLGCGGGDVTLLMARLVGPQGKVVGIDVDSEIISLARHDAAVSRLNQVEFRHGDVTGDLGEIGHDRVYARFLLTHLSQPERCLAEMVSACGPGGWVVVEDIEFTGSFCYPACAAYTRDLELYQQVVQRRGGDPNIGPKLPGLLRQAGLTEVQMNVVQPAHLDGEGKLMAVITLARVADAIAAEGLATSTEVTQMIEDLERIAADPGMVISLPRIFQVWGKRALE